MVLNYLWCQIGSQNRCGGEAAPGPSPSIQEDTNMSPKLDPQWLQHWSQNGARDGRTSMPAHYKHSKISWMTGELFPEWYLECFLHEINELRVGPIRI